ncbi:MAG TPA: hypothetical protein VGI82_01525 [Chitinophagaceae bacterium]
MKKLAILTICSYVFAITSSAQNITDSRQDVIDSTGSGFISNPTNLPFFNSTSNAEKIIADILDALGMQGNFKIKIADVPNAEATIRHHERYILYNPDFVNKVNTVTKNKWASIFILAHEVAHHLEGHTLTYVKNRPDVELQADEFAGYTLYKMGATLQQAQLAMYYIASADATKTHPARVDRLAAIAKGWNKANTQTKSPVSDIHPTSI